MKSNEIGKYIYSKLVNVSTVKKLINNRIYPLAAEFGTLRPYVVYSRLASTVNYTKDGLVYETATISIDCVADDYTVSVDIACAIRDVFDNLRYYPVIFQLSNTSESWSDDIGYVQSLVYEVGIG
jgi:hypothetical protein